MKKITLISLFVMLTGFLFANPSTYKLDNQKVDDLVENAVEMNFANLGSFETMGTSGANKIVSLSDEAPEPWLAWALTYTAGVGICGIHRLYLGTSVGVFIGYLLTGGGCGIVQTVDWIVLLIGAIEEDIDKYVDNPKFFMW